MDITKAPKKGTMYALFRQQVVYQPYSLEELEQSRFETEDLLELHLFDETEEYRCIKTRKDGYREWLINDVWMPHDSVYVEEILLNGNDADRQENLKETVKVVNYVVYDENDLLKINGYRLQEVR